ncbi:MAG: hypothetical protein PHR14_07460 [Oscillospiraceae bacterium]|nr:hypothetical protein [Oscillospiraceae bacterium]
MRIDIFNKKKITLGVLCTLCCLSVAVMILAIRIAANRKEAFTPPAFDPKAITGTPDVPESLGYSPLEVERGYKAYVCGKLLAKGSNVDVYFASHETNTVWLLLRIMDETESVLGETGIIRPGEYVETITLNTVPDKEKTVILKIIAYRPDTYTSMGTVGLNTKLRIYGQE